MMSLLPPRIGEIGDLNNVRFTGYLILVFAVFIIFGGIKHLGKSLVKGLHVRVIHVPQKKRLLCPGMFHAWELCSSWWCCRGLSLCHEIFDPKVSCRVKTRLLTLRNDLIISLLSAFENARRWLLNDVLWL